jgi:titin
VRGLVINRFSGGGVRILGATATNVAIAGNYIGTDATGSTRQGNLEGVVLESNAANNTVGGVTAADRNVISGNVANGVALYSGASGNVVAGNYIGTDAGGTLDLGNGVEGVNVIGVTNNTIGGSTAGAQNVISGNDAHGVFLSGASGNILAGNYIGTNAAGTGALGNGGQGVVIRDGSLSNRVGTDADGVNDAAERNVISGNIGHGVAFDAGANGNIVAGNYIGTDASGESDVGNRGNGVVIINSANNTIGGTTAAARNVVSGNDAWGINMSGSGATGNMIQGNLIGTDAAGTAALGNTQSGILLHSGSSDNTIGGLAAGARNIVSGNGGHGIQIASGTSNRIQGNSIGTDVTGTLDRGNGGAGVVLSAGATGNLIGGSAAGAGNLVSGNDTWAGVYLVDAGTADNRIQGNRIGTDAAGTAPLGNSPDGVRLQGGASNNTIGTDADEVADAAEGNLISGNVQSGVVLNSAGTTGNVVAGNRIGTNVTGTAAVPNQQHGVLIVGGASSNRIGTDGDGVNDTAERNVISGNVGNGVLLTGAGTANNVVAGNFIGTDVTGTAALGNLANGVIIIFGASANRVGTGGDGVADSAERNVISANVFVGVRIAGTGTGASNNVVAGNLIGTDVTGTIALGNHEEGIRINLGARFNRVGTNGDGVADAAERNVISGNASSGVQISGSGTDQNVVAGNFIGVDATGGAALGNGDHGIYVVSGAKGTRIGTDGDGVADAAERNVVSGNGIDGVKVQGRFSTDPPTLTTEETVVAGNHVGTDAAGVAALGNKRFGVFLDANVRLTRVGTTGDGVNDAAERNVISGNANQGVRVAGAGTQGNVVAGNLIGTNATGSAALGNGGDGVRVANGAQSNRIGTDGNGIGDAAEGNVIAFNGGVGVAISGAGTVGNKIRGNAIHANAGLGIDLDAGGNNAQASPVLTAAVPGAGTSVAGTFDGSPNTTFTVDFYASPTADPSGFGEGARHLGSITVTTDAGGHAAFSVLLAAATVAGEAVTATATDPGGNTSEFSAAVTAQANSQVLTTAVANLVASGTVNAGQGNAMTTQLAQAQRHIDLGDPKTAVNVLRGFRNHVISLVEEEVLTPQEAALLLDMVDLLIDELGG